MKRSATSLVTLGGRTIVIQWVHNGRSTSCSVSHRCEVISTSVDVTPSTADSRRTLQAKLVSGVATYRSRAVWCEGARAGVWGGPANRPTGSARTNGVRRRIMDGMSAAIIAHSANLPTSTLNFRSLNPPGRPMEP